MSTFFEPNTVPLKWDPAQMLHGHVVLYQDLLIVVMLRVFLDFLKTQIPKPLTQNPLYLLQLCFQNSVVTFKGYFVFK